MLGFNNFKTLTREVGETFCWLILGLKGSWISDYRRDLTDGKSLKARYFIVVVMGRYGRGYLLFFFFG